MMSSQNGGEDLHHKSVSGNMQIGELREGFDGDTPLQLDTSISPLSLLPQLLSGILCR